MNPIKKHIAFAALLAVLASCESNHFFKSEKKLKGDIIGVWDRIPISAEDNIYGEKWTFADGGVTMVKTLADNDTLYDDYVYAVSICSSTSQTIVSDTTGYYNDLNKSDCLDTLAYDVGTYTVDATVAAPFLKIEGLSGVVSPFYNSKWTIVQLDNDILEIATDYPANAGVLQKEFLKE